MNEIKQVSYIDKIKLKIINLFGYRQGTKFINETKPYIRKYSEIEELEIANIEEKLHKAIQTNSKNGSLVSGITEKECNALLEWVIQRDREILSQEESLIDSSLNGCCGLSQGVISTLLFNMGLQPRISNINPTITGKSLGGHAFNSVAIPVIGDDNNIVERNYLLDATYRQFFERDKYSVSGRFVKDKRFGGKVAPFAGYFLISLPKGNELAEKILKEGFVELTPENAKLYGDSFMLEKYMDELYRKKYKEGTTIPVPKKKELVTEIIGEQYIEWLTDPSRQDYRGIDFNEGELEEYYGEYMMKTPLMLKKDQRDINMAQNITKNTAKENVKEASLDEK